MFLEVQDALLADVEKHFQDQVHLYPAGRIILAERISSYLENSEFFEKVADELKKSLN